MKFSSRYFKFFFLLPASYFLLTIFSGCSAPYTPAPQILPQHIKKISIRPFVNNTTQYGLEEKLTLKVINEFVRDGRLMLVNNEQEADGVVAG